MPQGQLTQCLEGLLNLEKTARVAEDVTASKAACSAILEVCYKAKDWKLLEEHIVLLSKRRGQLKQASAARGAARGAPSVNKVHQLTWHLQSKPPS